MNIGFELLNQIKLLSGYLWQKLLKLRLGWSLILVVLLSSCVQYDVNVKFNDSNHGEIIQHVKLAERLTSFSGDQAQAWLNSILRRAQQLDGKTKKLSNQEIIVTIPFYSGNELEAKFNDFFNPTTKQSSNSVTTQPSEVPSIKSQLKVKQNNFLLLSRNSLIYDLDLRPLGLISTSNNVRITPGEILNLEFSLATPWGARSIEQNDALEPETRSSQQLTWKLQPGQLNHLEAVFWLPNPLGIGTLVIILFVAAGIYLRYKFMPDPTLIQPLPPTVPKT